LILLVDMNQNSLVFTRRGGGGCSTNNYWDSVLSGVADNFPALIECEKIQDRATLHGFD